MGVSGVNGGNVIAEGKPSEIIKNSKSLTGAYLSKKLMIPINKNNTSMDEKYVEIKGANGNNLKNLNVRFPLKKVHQYYRGIWGWKINFGNRNSFKSLSKKIYNSSEQPLSHEEVKGHENLDKIIQIDQTPIGRTPRSNPATYTGCFNFIREWYSQLPESRARGYKPGRFSF